VSGILRQQQGLFAKRPLDFRRRLAVISQKVRSSKSGSMFGSGVANAAQDAILPHNGGHSITRRALRLARQDHENRYGKSKRET
jgi:hypothetical protein